MFFNNKSSWSQLVSTTRSMALSLPFTKGSRSDVSNNFVWVDFTSWRSCRWGRGPWLRPGPCSPSNVEIINLYFLRHWRSEHKGIKPSLFLILSRFRRNGQSRESLLKGKKVDLIKIGCFVNMKHSVKSSWSDLVSSRRSTVLLSLAYLTPNSATLKRGL